MGCCALLKDHPLQGSSSPRMTDINRPLFSPDVVMNGRWPTHPAHGLAEANLGLCPGLRLVEVKWLTPRSHQRWVKPFDFSAGDSPGDFLYKGAHLAHLIHQVSTQLFLDLEIFCFTTHPSGPVSPVICTFTLGPTSIREP